MNLSLAHRWDLLKGAFRGQLDVKPGGLADSMLRGFWPSMGGEPPKRGGKQFLDTYNTMPWARGPMGRIASSMSCLTWRLYAQTNGQDEMGRPKYTRNRGLQRADNMNRKAGIQELVQSGNMKEIENHILLDALHNGNIMLSGKASWKVSSIYMDSVGECFWMKERNAMGKPIAFWPIPSYWIIDTPSPVHRFYKVSFRSWQGDIPDREIVWFKDPDPVMPYGRGSGTSQALADEMESDEYAAKHIKQFFYNNATPKTLIYPKGEMNNMAPEVTQQLERKWLDNNQGFWRAFKTQFLNREVGVHEFVQNFQHLQMNELRDHSRDTAFQTYGIPPEIMGVLENSNRATIDGAFYGFFKLCLEPRADFWQSEMQQKIVQEYDERLILDYDNPVQEDKDFRLKAYIAKPSTVTVNEWRKLQGVAPLPEAEGRLRFQAINETIVDGFEVTPPPEEDTGFDPNEDDKNKPKPKPKEATV